MNSQRENTGEMRRQRKESNKRMWETEKRFDDGMETQRERVREMKGLVTSGGGLCEGKVRGLVACCNQVLSLSDSSALVYRGL